MSGYPGDLSEAQADTLSWMRARIRREIEEDPSILELLPSNLEEEINDDMITLKFCRSCNWDAEKSYAMFLDALKWRRSFGVDTMTEADLDRSISEAGMFFFLRDGYDKENRPVAVILIRNHDKYTMDPTLLRRFCVFHMELCRRLVPPGVETATVVFDLEGFGMKNMDLEFIQFLLTVLGWYYPDTLGYLLIYNAPYLFSGFWTLVSALLDPVSASKVRFVDKEGMKEFIDEDVLPVSLGGTAPDPEHPIVPSQFYKQLQKGGEQ